MCNKSGYTLAEVLIVIAIIGVISAMTLPTLQKATGNKFESMKIKCFYIIEQTVTQMLDDDTMYPQSNRTAATGLEVRRNSDGSVKKLIVNGIEYIEDNTKFCKLFASKITKALNSPVKCEANKKTFTSSDGVDWYLPISNFEDDKSLVIFDVNGKEEPNCSYDEETCPKADVYGYYISKMGKLSPANCTFTYNSDMSGFIKSCH